MNCNSFPEGQERQEVKPHVKVVNINTGIELETKFPNDPLKQKVAKLVTSLHKSFKVLTSNRDGPQADRLHSPLGHFYQEQIDALEEAKVYFAQMRFKPRPKPNKPPPKLKSFGIKPFQKGGLITMSAVTLLHKDLRDLHGEPFLQTERTTQDHLERLFSTFRGLGGMFCLHPTALQFLQRLGQYLKIKFLKDKHVSQRLFDILT